MPASKQKLQIQARLQIIIAPGLTQEVGAVGTGYGGTCLELVPEISEQRPRG